MKLVFLVFALLVAISLSAAANAGESHYEVYYFHASWRCTNCTNAEEWAGEVVSALNSSNPGANIIYAPKQLETNKQLVSLTKAKRVDLVVAEVSNGKIVRHENLGNLLPMVGSKKNLQQHITDGVIAFSKKSRGAGELSPPGSIAPAAQITPSNRKMAVYVIQREPNNNKPREAALVSTVLSQHFPQIVQDKKVSITLLNPNSREHAGWLDLFKAKPGDVVVAILDDTTIETFSAIPGPAAQTQESGFMNAFANLIQQNVSQGGF